MRGHWNLGDWWEAGVYTTQKSGVGIGFMTLTEKGKQTKRSGVWVRILHRLYWVASFKC